MNASPKESIGYLIEGVNSLPKMSKYKNEYIAVASSVAKKHVIANTKNSSKYITSTTTSRTVASAPSMTDIRVASNVKNGTEFSTL